MTITATLIIVLTFSVLMHLALVAIIFWPLEPLRSLRSFAAKLSHPGRASRRAATQTPALQPTTNGADAPPAPFLISINLRTGTVGANLALVSLYSWHWCPLRLRVFALKSGFLRFLPAFKVQGSKFKVQGS